jgi:hypothetical protein
MAIRDVEVFNNKILNNNTVNVYIVHYKTVVDDEALRDTAASPITQQIFAPDDKRYYPFVQDIYFHDNEISGGGKSPDNRLTGVKALSDALGGKLPDFLYDGTVDPKWPRKGPNSAQICLQKNGDATFLNFDAAGQMKHPVHDLKRYSCALAPLTPVSIPQIAASSAGGN